MRMPKMGPALSSFVSSRNASALFTSFCQKYAANYSFRSVGASCSRVPALCCVASTALAHEHGVPVLADGAHAFEAMPLDVAAAGVDFYVMSDRSGCARTHSQ
jgi:hypothetical protein